MARKRASVFIGSSTEGLTVAKGLQVLLDQGSEVTLWNQGVFAPSQGTLESLMAALDQFDFAILVLTPDDLVSSRDHSKPAPRDNVLFELGLFMGGLGRNRTFIVHDRTVQLKLPSDLAGISTVTFELHSSGQLHSSLGAPATRIEQQISRLGLRDVERLRVFSEAAQGFDEASSKMEQLVELLARSRAVELDVISAQFGPLIDPERLKKIQKDFKDLEATLNRPKPAKQH